MPGRRHHAILADIAPGLDEVRPRLRRENEAAGVGSFSVRPVLGAQLPDLLKHRVAIEQLASISLLNAAPDLGPKFVQGSLAR
jgi:hypothetical protein